MPSFTYTPTTINDLSNLTEGWHVAFLLAVHDEPTPESWDMYRQSPRMWRWHFAVWEAEQTMSSTYPEFQSTVTSQKFSPPIKNFQASRAYLYIKGLIGRDIPPGEAIDLDALLPLNCLVAVTRHDKNKNPIPYANIYDVRAWPDGNRYRTEQMIAWLRQWHAEKAPEPQVAPQAAPVPAVPTPAVPTPAAPAPAAPAPAAPAPAAPAGPPIPF